MVQAYGKRCPFVIDFLIDLARRTRRRIAVRLVKGAYWDAEIKRAQVDGFVDFPAFTRKIHTDVSYIACARQLLAARDAVFPQFATHNAQTLATIFEMAGPNFHPGDYEFQCLHGMGEPLYDEVVGKDNLAVLRPVQVGRTVGGRTVVTKGLSEGDHVVVEGFQKLRPGATVTQDHWKPDAATSTAENGASAG